MKIQNLAILFIIIILPMSIILDEYTRSQVQTLTLQNSYDAKLNNATYDALKAFQLNTINSDTSDLANSKLRDVEASANTFFNSIASNFNMAGYNKDILSDYVPALVYTMYDGYYIYSPYNNTLDDTNQNEVIINDETGETEMKSDAAILNENNPKATYKQGERLNGIKPYIYYSCRYVKGDINVVITYSLDNYITVQGTIGGEKVYRYGYVLDNVKENGQSITYRDVPIGSEQLEEYINTEETYPYIKINGVKYYINDDNTCFSILNGEKYPQGTINAKESTQAMAYYKEANEFTKWVRDHLGELESTDAVDEQNNKIQKGVGGTGKYKIFTKDNKKSIEDPDSNFNQQRLEVIRYSIEKNLSTAIANYNNYSGVTANFQMPKLKEDEWDKIINHVSIISFLQGLNIGGKIYNGYSIITNNKNQETVSEDSIYILTDDNQYHRANEKGLEKSTNIKAGILNIDFERKSIVTEKGTHYFYPQKAMGSYSSIITQNEVETADNLFQFMASKENETLKRAYFTALARERYGMYKTNNNPEQLKRQFGITS